MALANQLTVVSITLSAPAYTRDSLTSWTTTRLGGSPDYYVIVVTKTVTQQLQDTQDISRLT